MEPAYQVRVKDTDEIASGRGGVAWNVTRLQQFIDATKTKENQYGLPTKDFKHYHDIVQIDRAYAMTTDPERPGILVEWQPGEWKLIDGNHRLYKAIQEGRELYMVWMVPFEEQLNFLIDRNFYDYMRSAYSEIKGE